MAILKFDQEITALIVIDLYNDFISEGGKIWDRLKGVAEVNHCVPHMMQVLDAARKAASASFMRCIVDIAPATTRLGSTLRPFRRQRGSAKASNTARGVARSVPGSSLSQATLSPRSIGVPVVLPIQISIYSSRSTGFISSSSWDSSRTPVWRRRSAMPLSLARGDDGEGRDRGLFG